MNNFRCKDQNLNMFLDQRFLKLIKGWISVFFLIFLIFNTSLRKAEKKGQERKAQYYIIFCDH